jgi:hypothetical protein
MRTIASTKSREFDAGPDEGSYVKFLLGGRVARGHRSPSRMRLRGSLRSALTGHP